MTDRRSPDAWPDLPPELVDLDRELRSIAMEERSSFGPELEAELRRRAGEGAPGRPSVLRWAVAAGVGTLLLAGLAVPPARAALVRLMIAVHDGATEVLGVERAMSERPPPLSAPPLSTPRAESPAPHEGAPHRGSEPASPDASELPGGPAGEWSTSGMAFPEIRDRGLARSLVRGFYPAALQRAGIGGTVRLQLWVDSTGHVAEVHLGRSSGVAALDRAALRAAPLLRFSPGLRRGAPVATWVEFDVDFRPTRDAEDPLPRVTPVDEPEAPSDLETRLDPEWRPTDAVLPPPMPLDAQGMLRSALGSDGRREDRWGGVERLLEGEPPPRALPLRWREEAAGVLETAITRDPDNPTPFLALGRIRKRQGLRTDARRLFERGIQRAERGDRAVPPEVLAELHFERAMLLREDWLPWSHLGRIPSVALAMSPCAPATPRPSATPYAPPEALIAWNFLCPGQFDRLLRARFESLERLKEDQRQDMLRSLYLAVEAFPGHPEANVELLLALADAGRWQDLLEGADRFSRASAGHAHALLLEGLALQRMGRSREASVRFGRALERLPPPTAEALRDIRPLLDPDEAGVLDGLDAAERAERVQGFWAPHDPVLTTPVNEREIEHLARSTYALLRFGGPGTPPGEVWVRYGRPAHIRAFGEGSSLRTVFWDYGPGPDVPFQRPATSMNLEATPEGRAYLDELARVFPHRYDPGPSELLPLPAQMARFRGSEGDAEIEIHTEIPRGLATGPSDSLELGVFLLGSDGERWTIARRRLPAVVMPLHLRAPVPGRASWVVVELHHARMGVGASLRSPLAVDGRGGLQARVSDLVIVEPAAPFSAGTVRRSAAWVKPRTRPGLPERGEAGILFEVYDLPRGDARFTVEVELEDLASGARRELPFKPAGELEFRRRWERTPRLAGTAAEYLTLDLSGVEAGSHLLRVRVRLPGEDAFVETSRALEVG